MKKAFVFIAAILAIGLTAQAQTNTPLQQIQVTGKSELSVKPDEAIVQIRLERKALKVSEATAALNKMTSEIEKQVKKSKPGEYKFTTDNYHVNINRIYQKGTSKDSGYVASQTIKITVSEPEEGLVKVVEALNANQDIMFDVSFTVSEKMAKSYEQQLLKAALEDARQKASLIAETMSLGSLKVSNINYSSIQNDYPRPIQMQYMRAEKSMAADVAPTFSPDEQKLSDEVHVTFSFEK